MDPISIAMALANYAPKIIKWVSGSDKAEAAAAQVVQIAQQVTGKGNGNDALAAIGGDPALQIELRKAIMANEADLDKAFLADRQDARARDVALAQAGRRNIRADVMVLVDAVGLIACLALLMFFRQGMPPEVITLVTTIASIFGLCLRDAHQFEFGSSRGSAEKTQLLGQKQ